MPSGNVAFPSFTGPADAIFQAGDLLNAGVLSVDGALRVTGWNRWMEAATGLAAPEAVGRSVFELFPALVGARAADVLRRSLAGETVVLSQRFHEYLLPIRPPAGFESFQWMQQSVRVAPLLCDQRVDGAVVVIQDVTERVAREAELQAAVKRAEEASRGKSDFMASLSHELRTPLGAIIGYADLLGEEIVGPLLESQKQHVARIRAGGTHLLHLIEQILSFARSEAGREEVALEPTDLTDVVRAAITLVQPQAGAKGMELRFALPDNPLVAHSDPGKIRQILINLLANAIKFSDEGPVDVSLYGKDGMACIEVLDRGPGISNADKQRIFEPFTQLEHEHASRGTGLGLPVSRRLARLLGGDVDAESTMGEGSCFTLHIPLAGPAGAPAQR